MTILTERLLIVATARVRSIVKRMIQSLLERVSTTELDRKSKGMIGIFPCGNKYTSSLLQRLFTTSSLMAVVLGAIWLSPMIVVNAQTPPSEDRTSSLLLILDASGSMNSNDGSGQSKIAAARQALNQMVDSLPEGTQVGLRVYGHRASNAERDRSAGCRDTELIVPIQPLNRQSMKSAINSFQARGWTPIGSSLQSAERDLPPSGQRTIVLVSDGLDTCGAPDPCEMARDLAKRGVNLKVHTIGFQVDAQAREQLKCIAGATGGTYQDAGSAIALSDQLKQISARAMRKAQLTGTPVKGGAVYREAPHLTPGTYTDTILPGETLWYAADLQAGEGLKVTTTLDHHQAKYTVSSALRVYMVNPGLEDLCCSPPYQDFKSSISEPVVSISTQTKTVGTSESDMYAREQGTYYFRVKWEYGPGGSIEFPLEFLVDITRKPAQTEAALNNGGSKAAAASLESANKGNEKTETEGISDAINSTLLLISVGLGFLVIILGAVLFTVLRRQRT